MIADRQNAPTEGTLTASDGQALPLQETHVEASLLGPVATVSVEQRFLNDRDQAIEAVYSFPLPQGASVHQMLFRIGDRIVRAVIKRKAEAREIYERARSEGRAATLLEEDSPDLFTLSVANLAPGAEIEVELTYQQLLPFDDGEYRFDFPMVAPTRYLDAPPDASIDAVMAASAALPPPRRNPNRAADVSIEVTLPRHAEEVRCRSHAVTHDRNMERQRVTLRAEDGVPNRDFHLTFQAARAGVAPVVQFERAEDDPRGTFLLTITPPKSNLDPIKKPGMQPLCCGNCGGPIESLDHAKEIPGMGTVVPCRYCHALLTPGTDPVTRPTLPRDVLILVDRSASMRSEGHALAREATRELLTALPQGDTVRLVTFDHEREFYGEHGERYEAVSPELIERVDAFLLERQPRGGTELTRALEAMADVAKRDGRTQAIVLITDAAIGNTGRVLSRIKERVTTPVYLLGVGAGANRRLLTRIATTTGGIAEVVQPGDRETLKRFARRVRDGGPVLMDLQMYWEAEVTEYLPRRIPDLHGGQPIRVLGRYEGSGESTLVITGVTPGGKSFRQEVPVTLPTVARTHGLTRAWARKKIDSFTDKSHEALGEAAPELTALALAHNIVSPFTSLVAEDSEVAVEPTEFKKGVLEVIKGEGVGARFTISKPRVTIGRRDGSDLVLAANNVSRFHFEIRAEGDGYVLYDSESTNATYVEGRAVRKRALKDGDVIGAGDYKLRFTLSQETFACVPRETVGDRTRGDLPPPAPLTRSRPRPMSPSRASSRGTRGGAPPAMPAPMPPAMAAPPPPAMAAPVPSAPSPEMGVMMERSAPAARTPSRTKRRPASAPTPPPVMPPRPPGTMDAMPMEPADRARAETPPPQVPVTLPGSEPYPERELAWLKTKKRGELDLVFMVDATGSMGSQISEVRQRLQQLIVALQESALCESLRLGLVSYRDHPPQENTYITQVTALTDDFASVRGDVLKLVASGGGDGPEAVTAALHDVARLSWRPNAARAVVWFGDAPPHGVTNDGGDGFPSGPPTGDHWFTQSENLREMGIAVYAIGCLPNLRSYNGGEAVYRAIARATGGMYLLLRDAPILVPMICGAAESELDRQRIEEHVREAITGNEDALRASDEHGRLNWIVSVLKNRGVKVREMKKTDGVAQPPPMTFREPKQRDVEIAVERLRARGVSI